MTVHRRKPAAAHPGDGPKNVLTESEAARYIGRSISFLRKSRIDGDRRNRTQGPAWLKTGRAVSYLREDLDAWLQAHRVQP